MLYERSSRIIRYQRFASCKRSKKPNASRSFSSGLFIFYCTHQYFRDAMFCIEYYRCRLKCRLTLWLQEPKSKHGANCWYGAHFWRNGRCNGSQWPSSLNSTHRFTKFCGLPFFRCFFKFPRPH